MPDEAALLEQRIREKAHQLWQEAGAPEGSDQHFWLLAQREIEGEEAQLDGEIAGSFPASDPPSTSVVTGATGETATDSRAPAASEQPIATNTTSRKAPRRRGK